MKRFFIAALILVVAASAAEAGDRTVKLAISNMTCVLCPLTVSTAIGRVAGVRDVTVDYKTKTAVVVYDDAKTTAAKVAEASTLAGFPARAEK